MLRGQAWAARIVRHCSPSAQSESPAQGFTQAPAMAQSCRSQSPRATQSPPTGRPRLGRPQTSGTGRRSIGVYDRAARQTVGPEQSRSERQGVSGPASECPRHGHRLGRRRSRCLGLRLAPRPGGRRRRCPTWSPHPSPAAGPRAWSWRRTRPPGGRPAARVLPASVTDSTTRHLRGGLQRPGSGGTPGEGPRSLASPTGPPGASTFLASDARRRATASSTPMRIAYLVNQYPKVSHTFIRREIAALEARGVRSSATRVRRVNEPLADPADRAEQERTRVVLDGRAGGARGGDGERRARAGRRRSPGVGARGAGRLRLRARARHPRRLSRRGLRARRLDGARRHRARARPLRDQPSAVAMLAGALGGPGYSFHVHGPEEFDKPAAIALGEKIERSPLRVRDQQLRPEPALPLGALRALAEGPGGSLRGGARVPRGRRAPLPDRRRGW